MDNPQQCHGGFGLPGLRFSQRHQLVQRGLCSSRLSFRNGIARNRLDLIG
jgi:hypothetical protein